MDRPQAVRQAGKMDFAIGAAAASIAICFTNPFDVLKTRLQVVNEQFSKGVDKPSAAYKSTAGAMKQIVQKEGLRGMYRGLVPAICFQSVGNAFRFGVYDFGKRFAGVDGAGQMSFGVNLICALIAGITAGIAACPFFIIKTQFQIMTNSDTLAAGFQHKYEGGMISAISSIYRTCGIRGFFRGLDAFVPRVAVLVAVQLSTYDAVKHFLGRERHVKGHAVGSPPAPASIKDTAPSSTTTTSTAASASTSPTTPPAAAPVSQSEAASPISLPSASSPAPAGAMESSLRRSGVLPLKGTTLHLTSSFVASCCATFVMQPFDLVASRLMNQPVSAAGVGTYYTSAVDCVRKTFEREGVRGFWRGGMANWMRVCPQYMLTFVLVEQFRKLLKPSPAK